MICDSDPETLGPSSRTSLRLLGEVPVRHHRRKGKSCETLPWKSETPET